MINLSSDAARVSVLSRRQALRIGLFASVGATTIGAGLLSAGASASADAGIAAFATQEGWRWCNKCQGFFYGPSGVAGRCPAGDAHDAGGSFPYYLWYSDDPPVAYMQSGWKWCRKCQGLAYAGSGPGWCPGTGHHDHTGSFNYHLWHDVGQIFAGEQDQWRWCNKCQGLFYGPQQGSSWCGESGRHNGSGSFNYMIQFIVAASAANTVPRQPNAVIE